MKVRIVLAVLVASAWALLPNTSEAQLFRGRRSNNCNYGYSSCNTGCATTCNTGCTTACAQPACAQPCIQQTAYVQPVAQPCCAQPCVQTACAQPACNTCNTTSRGRLFGRNSNNCPTTCCAPVACNTCAPGTMPMATGTAQGMAPAGQVQQSLYPPTGQQPAAPLPQGALPQGAAPNQPR